MLAICTFLWNHADVIECGEDGKPVQVRLEEFIELPNIWRESGQTISALKK